MIKLDNVTLLTIDGVGTDINAIRALKYSMKGVKYGDIKYLSSGPYTPTFCNKISIPKMSWNDYNKFCLTDLKNYINTEFVLLIQSDGFVINPDKWCDTFLSYDYIGAPWTMHNLNHNIQKFIPVLEECIKNKQIYQVGNGGFSLRSKKLLEETAKLYQESHYGIPEDLAIANLYQETLKQKGLKFTNNVGVAGLFSCEAKYIDNIQLSSENSFGFHCKDSHPDKIALLEYVSI
jgi:hypothetical protein